MATAIEWALAVTAIVSAVAAAISARLASQANLNEQKGERERRMHELSLLASRVVATSMQCDGMANDLQGAYRSSAVTTGVLGVVGNKCSKTA